MSRHIEGFFGDSVAQYLTRSPYVYTYKKLFILFIIIIISQDFDTWDASPKNLGNIAFLVQRGFLQNSAELSPTL